MKHYYMCYEWDLCMVVMVWLDQGDTVDHKECASVPKMYRQRGGDIKHSGHAMSYQSWGPILLAKYTRVYEDRLSQVSEQHVHDKVIFLWIGIKIQYLPAT